VRDEASTRRAIEGASVVINCVAIGFEDTKGRVTEVQEEGSERIARIAAETGASQLVHVSAIGADTESDSYYSSTKGSGEAAVLEHFPAAAIVAAVDQNKSGVFELGGPEVQTFREMMLDMLDVTRRRRLILNLPMPIARVMASILDFVQFISFGWIPNVMITRDQIKNLAVDNVVAEDAQGFDALGITPRSSDGILETYLYSFRQYGQYTELTESAKGLRD